MKSESHKIRGDLLWSYLAFGMAAASGLGTNLGVAYLYGSSTLGVFNQVLAVYIVVAQLASFGIHLSVLKHVAHGDVDQGKVLGSGLVSVVALSAVWTLGLYAFGPVLGAFLSSEAVTLALGQALLGIFLFPINKVLIATLNGKRRIVEMAICQTLRAVFLLVGVTLPFWWDSTLSVTIAFSLAETAVTVTALGLMGVARGIGFSSQWWKTHLSFGGRGFLSGALIELNSRVDVLMVGFFLSDQWVGIYSFAAILTEGFAQLLVVLKNNLNPLLSRLSHESNVAQTQAIVWEVKKRVYPTTVACSLALGLAFPLFAPAFLPADQAHTAWAVLGVLLTAITLVSGVLPFDSLLVQSGRPGTQTLVCAITVAVNFVANLALIPLVGVLGAALGSALAYLTNALILDLSARTQLRISLFLPSRKGTS